MTSVRNIYFVPLGDAVPQLVATTFEIGVRERRDILFLSFRDIPDPRSPEDEPWEHIPERQVILRWLDDNGVGWEPCFHISPGTLIAPYRGSIYLDVAPTEGSEQYRQLLAFLEDDFGKCRFEGVDFWLMPLEKSLKWNEKRQVNSD